MPLETILTSKHESSSEQGLDYIFCIEKAKGIKFEQAKVENMSVESYAATPNSYSNEIRGYTQLSDHSGISIQIKF